MTMGMTFYNLGLAANVLRSLHKYIHDWSLQSLIRDYDQASDTILFVSGETSTLKLTLNDRFLSNNFITNFHLLSGSLPESAEEVFSFRYLTWALRLIR